MKCQICGKPSKDDLFSYVTQEPVCSICKLKWIGGSKTTPELISLARAQLGLREGEYLNQDNGSESKKILGIK